MTWRGVFELLLFILCTSELFHIVWSHIVSSTDDTKSFAVISIDPHVVTESLNHDLAAIDSLYLKWHI